MRPGADRLIRRADLSDADLTGAVAVGVVLASANLNHTLLKDTRMIGADLSHARMTGAQLRGATLTEAEVRHLMRHEFAVTAEDVLWRRTKLGLRVDAEQVAALEAFMSEARAERAAAE